MSDYIFLFIKKAFDNSQTHEIILEYVKLFTNSFDLVFYRVIVTHFSRNMVFCFDIARQTSTNFFKTLEPGKRSFLSSRIHLRMVLVMITR